MERLTYEKRPSSWNLGKYPTNYTSRHTFQEVVARLAAYEETGLEPEEIKVILERYRAFRSAISDETGQPMVSWTRAGEICGADKDGRLVVLPCKVRDTIFMAIGRYGITGFEEDRCDGFFINREGVLQIKAQCYSGNHATYGFPGETVFLTREEAEEALKKREEADNEKSDSNRL